MCGHHRFTGPQVGNREVGCSAFNSAALIKSSNVTLRHRLNFDQLVMQTDLVELADTWAPCV